MAEVLSRTMKKVYYYSPTEREFTTVAESAQGYGVGEIERLDDFFPRLDEIDLFVFPDIGFGGLQKHLRNIGKAVWGSNGADELEQFRTFFLDTLDKLGLPTVHTKRLEGLDALMKHLEGVKDKWIKVDKFRGDMETWRHRDFAHSRGRLERMAVSLGGTRDEITFLVQDPIKTDVEIGADRWCIDGKYPSFALQGYEKKNQLYLGRIVPEADIAPELAYVDEKMAPILKAYGYRNWVATEVRVSDGVPYFTDLSARFSGLASESVQEICTNWADVVWHGANGIVIEPEFEWLFVAEAGLHYESDDAASAVGHEGWKILDIPKKARRWVKLSNYCEIDGIFHLIPNPKEEIGVVVGVGNSIKESIKHLQGTLELIKDCPLSVDLEHFPSLVKTIQDAEAQGIKFGDDVPSPEEIAALVTK